MNIQNWQWRRCWCCGCRLNPEAGVIKNFDNDCDDCHAWFWKVGAR